MSDNLVLTAEEIELYGFTVGKGGKLYEVCRDSFGRRLWINASDGSAVARFNVSTGVDVHNTVTDQMLGSPECLWCTHDVPDYATWRDFVLVVKEQFGIEILDTDIVLSELRYA